MILLLTCRGISVSFVTISFLIAKPTPVSHLSLSGLPLQKKEYSKSLRPTDSENLVSQRAAMSMLYLASSIATRAVRLSGRSVASRSRRVLTFHCPIISSCLLPLPSCFPLSTDEVEQRGPWYPGDGRSGMVPRAVIHFIGAARKKVLKYRWLLHVTSSSLSGSK